MKEEDIVIDIESCLNYTIKEAGHLNTSTDEDSVSPSPSADAKNVEPEKNAKKEKPFPMNAKKPPKPPRPPRGLPLDAADQKLIKEISELAVVRRARIERMKALKKMKAAKASSGSSSSGGNLIAMVFTLLFCIVIIFQGCHPSRVLRSPNGAMEGNIVGVGPPSFMDLAPGLHNKDEAKKSIF